MSGEGSVLIKTRVVRLIVPVLLFATAALGNQQQHPGAHGPAPRPNNTKPNKSADKPQERKTGEWLQKNQSLPPAQQEKALENDLAFQKLPPERQAQLKERLRKFNSMSPEQRDRVLKNIAFMESLTPQQREQFQKANQEFQGLPENRKMMVRAA